MNTPTSDEELGRIFRARAKSIGYSPMSLLSVAEAYVRHQNWSIMPTFPPRPSIELEEELTTEHLVAWPDWTAKLISPGCKMQQMVWHEGTITTRLVSRQWFVLAAEVEHPVKPKEPHEPRR